MITIGLIAGIVEALTGIMVIPGMTPISEGFAVVADIAMVLAGAFPMMHVLTKVLKRPLMNMGRLLGINETASAGMVASLANSVSMIVGKLVGGIGAVVVALFMLRGKEA